MRDDLHVLTGSYVLDAVSDTEREEFERHLQHCPTCDAEVRGLRETAARLALACAMTPMARVVTASDAHVETARTSAGGSVTVVTSAALREAVVSSSGMKSLPSSRVYQVWVMSSSGARSAGLMHGSSLLAAVRPGDRIGIKIGRAHV